MIMEKKKKKQLVDLSALDLHIAQGLAVRLTHSYLFLHDGLLTVEHLLKMAAQAQRLQVTAARLESTPAVDIIQSFIDTD